MTTAPGQARLAEEPRDSTLTLRVTCLLVSLLAALPALRLLSFIWTSSDYLAHGYLIPLTSAGLVYARRARIAETLRSARAPTAGPWLVLAAAALQAGAVLAEAGTTAGIGVVLTTAATAYAVGGGKLLRMLSVPVALLLLMVPPPVALQDRLLFGLKGVVIEASVALLQAAGYSVAATGNLILVPGHELFVANACSGLTSIVTLLPLGVVIAYLLGRGVWRRLLIVGCVVPIAMAGNMARVVITVALVSRWGLEFAQGMLHESFGLVTFLTGTVVLLGVARLVR